jgi:DNA-binding HxlR family transcriptional regulator
MADIAGGAQGCCPHFHAAVELIGRRWTGAIIYVLLQGGAMRFGEIATAVPALSDRLLSQRLKDLEAQGIVERTTVGGPASRTRYALTPMGRSLAPAVGELETWGRRWLDTPDITFRPV